MSASSRKMKGLVLGVFFLSLSTVALAGPPFQTDDPDPVEYRHFEAYMFELSDGTPKGGTGLEAPAFEMNWGAVPNLQLHLIVPFASNIPPNSGPVYSGIGDIELGAKYRLVKEDGEIPEIGIFPFVESPSGNASRGLGVGSTWYRLPLWLQKSWGPWTTYGGGGEVIANASGYKDYPFAGWLLQRQLSDALMLGGELYGHGGEGSAATSTASSLMLDLGGSYSFTPGFQLLIAAGHTVAGQAETYTYLSLYWTWGMGVEKPASNGGVSVPAYSAMLKPPRS
jgi:hypothetical protein